MMRKAVVVLTPLLFFVATQVLALGLGNLTLESSLNQPLRARIEIIDLGGVSPGDITVQLASPQDFNRFNAERPAFLTDITFEVVRTQQGVFVNLSSSQAIREPFLNIIIDTRWPSGRILSEHTVLLDLPAFSGAQSLAEPVNAPVTPAAEPPQGAVQREPATTQAATPTAPEPVIEPAPEPAVEPEPEQVAETPAPQPTESALQPDSLEILESDTLWEIALRVRPDSSVSVHQTMLAIQRLNPQAFPDGNINRLIAGEVLRVPDLSEIVSVNQQQAVSEVNRQNQQANIGVEPLAAPASGPDSVASGQQGQLRVLTTEDVEPASPDAGGVLAEENAALDARIQALENQLALQEEESDRANLQRQELMSRLTDLDAQIASAMELISLQDQQLAQLQESLAEAGATATQPAQIAEPSVANTQVQQPRSLMDSIVSALSNSTTILIAVAVVVVLLMVMFLIRRNRAVTAEGFEEDIVDELNADDDDGDVLRDSRFRELEDSPDDRDLKLPQGAVAMESGGRDVNDDQHTRIDLGVPIVDDDLIEDPAATSDDSTEVVDFDLGSPRVAAKTGTDDAVTELGDSESDDISEIVDFDLDEFIGDDVDNADDVDATAEDSQDEDPEPEVALDIGGEENTDPGASAFTDEQDEDEPEEEEASLAVDDAEDDEKSHDANEEYDEREYGSVDFDLSDAGVATAAVVAASDDKVEAEADELEAFDFDLTDEIDSTEEVDDEPESIEFQSEAAAAVTPDADTGIDLATDEEDDEGSEDDDEQAPGAIEFSSAMADATDEQASDDDSDDESDDAAGDAFLEGAVEFSAENDDVEEIELELPEDDEENDEAVEFEDVLDDEITADEMVSTGIDFDLSAANEAVEEAASQDIEEIEDIEFSDDEDSDDIAEVIDEDQSAAAPEAAIELENLDFLSTDMDSAADGAEDDIDFLSDDDEAATKLDLAYAYKKMGDMDGAREILEEVLKEGNDDQVTEARSLMEALVK